MQILITLEIFSFSLIIYHDNVRIFIIVHMRSLNRFSEDDSKHDKEFLKCRNKFLINSLFQGVTKCKMLIQGKSINNSSRLL